MLLTLAVPRPRVLLALAACALAPASTCAQAQAPAGATRAAPAPRAAAKARVSGTEIRQELRRFAEMGRVLYVAAHPDDENTQLITYLARGRSYRTAYLSLTRGDGGQNVLGGEFGAALGTIRTQELLAARRIDGAQQFFTRALDFGFSKTADETLRIWDRQQVLGDVVRVIRTFRPDVIITRFSPTAFGTHGHHTASAILALEAFKLAGDPKAFPEQLQYVKPWQPKRILQNGRGEGGLQMDISGDDAVTGESFSSIAGRSRAMHKSQGFDGFTVGATRPESFQLLAGEPATNDIFDGIDTTWNRFPGCAEVAESVAQALAAFDTQSPELSVPALLRLSRRLAVLTAPRYNTVYERGDSVVDEKRRELSRIIRDCVGLEVKTTVVQAEATPGEALKVRHAVLVRSNVPVRWSGVTYSTVIKTVAGLPANLRRGQEEVREGTPKLRPRTPLSQPYWLREEPAPTDFGSRDAAQKLIGTPESPTPLPATYWFKIGGEDFVWSEEPVQVLAGTSGERARRLEVVPPVSLKIATPVRLFAPGSTRAVQVEVLAARPGSGSLWLNVPEGWKAEPTTQEFKLATAASRATLTFQVTAPNAAASASITARALVGDVSVSTQRVEIDYPHIPPILLQPPAQAKAVALDLKIRGQSVGYIAGAGDSVAEALEQMGYRVTRLTGADLTLEKLRPLDAVVLGVRAFNVRDDLPAKVDTLLAYAELGGTVIAQYNRPDNLKVPADKIAPFALRLSGQRVTDENAAVTLLAPDHPALNSPNKITAEDFAGWVQERGVYFPSTWAPEWTPLLSAGDPGEEPLKGGLLVAKCGRGHFAYTGLVLFRQLPAGVPGAYRLMANLVSLGK